MIFSEDLLKFVDEHQHEDVRMIALQGKRYPHIDVQLAIQQIKGRQIIKEKSSFWYTFNELRYPPHLSMEQASSEVTAKYKAELCSGDSFVDLTGGLGIDFYFMSQKSKSATYVEQNNQLCEIAEHNFKILPQLCNVDIENQDSVSFLDKMSAVDTVYIDPARRDSAGKKTVLISDCTPNLEEIDDLLNRKSKRTIIKLSPMLDISLALKSLTNVSAVHILSVKNECKELVFVKENQDAGERQKVTFRCVDFTKEGEIDFTFSNEDETEIKYTSDVLRYLYEPNSSIMKAGGYSFLQKEFDVAKLHPNSHLYTSEYFIENFPGRVFEVKNILTLNKKEIKESISGLKQANITVRNFPLSVDDLRRKLKLKDGGDSYIFATTIIGEKRLLILTNKASS